MESRWKNINSYWGFLLIDELVRNGVEFFCISPGSRSTPLTIAAAENPNANTIICHDERGAAFYALGYGCATARPGALICTSGTASANYFPAIVEAHQSNIPLLILTADRPPELQDTGANQTVDQVNIYGEYVNHAVDLPCPDTDIPPAYVLTTIDQAVYRTKSSPTGPVHLNCKFREPLEPTEKSFLSSYRTSIQKWENSNVPYTNYLDSRKITDSENLKTIFKKIKSVKKGLLVVGRLPDAASRSAVASLINRLKWPVFADITSGIREVSSDENLIEYFDQILLSEKVKSLLSPEIIMHFGRPLTSKRYIQYVDQYRPVNYIHVSDNHNRLDPVHIITQRITTDISHFCKSIIKENNTNKNSNGHKWLTDKNKQINKIVKEYENPEKKISEISVARLVAQNLKSDHGLFLASSMPVRDFDMYAGKLPKNINVSSNRGASGIDGTIASAAGFRMG